MKMKDRFYSKTIGCIIAMLAIVLGISSCKDDFTTDNTSFALYYTSMTDIAPSMTGVIAKPTYKGAAPSDFKIIEVSYSSVNEDGKETRETYTGECFSIVPETGEIMINSTAEMKTGKYLLSVSCVAAGNTYTYKDAVVVNFLKAVPNGISVEPNFLEVKLADVKNKDSETVFPTAQVGIENSEECISILGYKISNIKRIASDDSETYIDNSKVKLFSISETGVISINKSSDYDAEVVKAGIYKIDLKLTTAASPNLPEEEGLFVNALTVNLTAAPTAISYKEGFIETGVEGEPSKPRGAFISSKPLVAGSTNNATYEITAIKKSSGGTFTDASEAEKAFFSIDAATGIVSVPNTHTFILNDVYKVSVRVTNPDGSYTGEDVLTLTVVDWVDPLTAFGYPELSVKQGMNCISGEPLISDKKGVEFSLIDLADEYEEYVSINKSTGVVTIEKYNSIPIGNFEIAVKAKNFKGESIGKLVIEVQDNPNYFTYISYGNNLVDEQIPGSIYDNQFRFRTLKELNEINLIPTTDIKEGQKIEWKIVGKHQYKGADDNAFINWDSDAKITVNMQQAEWNNVEYTLTVILVSATVGSGEDAFTRTVPLCFNYVKPQGNDGTAVLYTPFVFHVNPKYGGRSVVPVIENQGNFVMDYRRTFNYYNINGVNSNGEKLKEGSPANKDKKKPYQPKVECFLTDLWKNVAINPDDVNYGSKYPMSYWVDGNKRVKNPVELSENTLAYVDNTPGVNQFSVVVTKNFYYDGWGDGVVTGQMTFVTDGNTENVPNGKKTFPFAIWLDKSYVQK